jgi:hypothetical protein
MKTSLRRFIRRSPALAAALSAVVALAAAPAAAQLEDLASGGANNVVLASTTGEGAVQARAGLQVVPFGGDALGSENLALARSTSCTDCRTVAVAVQVVYATGDPNIVVPGNFAVSANADCLRCATYAYAYQYVLTTEGQVHLSPAGRLRVSELRREIADAADSSLGFDALTARLDELTAELKAVVDGELVAAGKTVQGASARHIETGP